ncbi:MAG: hypothetical protein CL424_09920 [Acidimicrobiaceae bacterium]|nr:hypothetical protein [Acidimicrobiaceae bacterium]
MEPSDANALHADLVAAFFRPPRVVACGFEGFADGEVTIVSHVELWPWRTVVRGSVTRSGSVGYNEGWPSESDGVRQAGT